MKYQITTKLEKTHISLNERWVFNLNSPHLIIINLLSSLCFGAKYLEPGEDVLVVGGVRCRFAPILAIK